MIVWSATGRQQDTWFWHFWPEAGSTLLVTGSEGYGPHNDNPEVYFVNYGGVLAAAPPGGQMAWTRIQGSAR